MVARLALALVVMGCALALACTGAPPTPKPEQYFKDAQANLAGLEFDTALKNLDRMTKAAGEGPLAQQGMALRAAVHASLAEASKEMAEAFGTGAKQPSAAPRRSEFTKERSDSYSMARTRLISSLEGLAEQRGKLGAEAVPLTLPFPSFTGTESQALARLKSGGAVGEAELRRAELEAARNALARNLARLAGAGDDVNKGKALFDKGGVQVDPRVYLLEMSNTLMRLAEIFGRPALDDPKYQRLALELLRDTADVVLQKLQDKPDQDLETRAKKLKADCEKQLKALSK